LSLDPVTKFNLLRPRRSRTLALSNPKAIAADPSWGSYRHCEGLLPIFGIGPEAARGARAPAWASWTGHGRRNRSSPQRAVRRLRPRLLQIVRFRCDLQALVTGLDSFDLCLERGTIQDIQDILLAISCRPKQKCGGAQMPWVRRVRIRSGGDDRPAPPSAPRTRDRGAPTSPHFLGVNCGHYHQSNDPEKMRRSARPIRKRCGRGWELRATWCGRARTTEFEFTTESNGICARRSQGPDGRGRGDCCFLRSVQEAQAGARAPLAASGPIPNIGSKPSQ
jgi:hypothetical protein